MADPVPYLIRGGEQAFFRLPESWRLLAIAAGPAGPPPPASDQLLSTALSTPIDAPPLADCVSASDTVAVLVEDATRPAPKALMLDGILSTLARAGVPDDRIRVVVALGTHRPLSETEMAAVFGPAVRRYRFINHDSRAEDLVAVGRLDSGRPVRINRWVAEADFRIGIGTVIPHPLNGFGGGGKILFPGAADFYSIQEHHCRLSFAPGTRVGRLSGNPFYQLGPSAALDVRIDFLVNCVMDSADRVGAVVAGTADGAFAAGVAASRRLLSRRFARRSEVTIVSTFPYTEATQFIKTVAPAAAVTVAGGCILLVFDGSDPLPPVFVAAFEQCRQRFGGDRALSGVLEGLRDGDLPLPDAAVDFNMAVVYTLVMQSRFDIHLCGEAVTAQQSRRMGFRPAASLAQAVAEIARQRPEAGVNVIPAGGLLLPEVAER